jgi:hypothetical protein
VHFASRAGGFQTAVVANLGVGRADKHSALVAAVEGLSRGAESGQHFFCWIQLRRAKSAPFADGTSTTQARTAPEREGRSLNVLFRLAEGQALATAAVNDSALSMSVVFCGFRGLLQR